MWRLYFLGLTSFGILLNLGVRGLRVFLISEIVLLGLFGLLMKLEF